MRSTITTVLAIGCAIVAVPTPTAWADEDFVALAVSDFDYRRFKSS